MWKYILKRIFWLVVVLFAAGALIFTIMYFIPGDPAEMLIGDNATAEQIQALRDKMGLNDPYIVRLGRFLFDTFFKFDLGTSYQFKVPVADELFTRIPRTLTLGSLMIILGAIVGIPLGILAAINQNKWQDNASMVIAMLGVSVPSFWLALLLILLFAQTLNWLPSFGIGSWKNYVLPVLAGSIRGIAMLARQTRSSMLEVIRSDYTVTARAKGVREKNVVLKHMLPNALIPVITVLGASFGYSIAGTVILETVFSLPGVGLYLMAGIGHRDYPIVQGCVVFLAAFAAITMLIVDLIYAAVDPRIKARYVSGKKVSK